MSSALGGVKKKGVMADVKVVVVKTISVLSAITGFMLFSAMLYLVHETGADANRLALACVIVVLLFGFWMGRRSK